MMNTWTIFCMVLLKINVIPRIIFWGDVSNILWFKSFNKAQKFLFLNKKICVSDRNEPTAQPDY